MAALFGGGILIGVVTTVKAGTTAPYTIYYETAEPGTAPEEIPAGYVFGGWYEDADCKEPLSESGAAYAKLVDADVLGVKAQITARTTAVTEKQDIRFVTTVDSLNYQNVGFEITINGVTKTKESNTVYTRLYAVGDTGEVLTYEPTEFSDESAYFEAFTVRDVPQISYGTVITARAYWTTLDGTVVYGLQTKKTVNMGIFESESVDEHMIFSGDTTEYILSRSGNVAQVNTEDYKEGAGALEVECTAANQVIYELKRSEGVDLADYQGGKLHFWFYVEDKSYLNSCDLVVELTSSGVCDSQELQWVVGNSSVNTGWNEYTLNFSSAQVTGTVDYENINFMRIWLNGGTSSGKCQIGLVTRIDGVCALPAGTILSCDTTGYLGSSSGTLSLTSEEYKEGSAAIRCENSSSVWYQFPNMASLDLSAYSDGQLRFWLYINDTSYLNSANPVSVELSSSTSNDNEELQWNIPVADLKNGWNEITLPIAAPSSRQGTISLSSVRRLRIFHNGGKTGLVTILDDVRVTERQAQIVETLYETDDVVIADFIPTQMGYAVDATGEEDSTAGIQQALNDCSTMGGGTVYLPAGTYKITGTITIPAYVTLRGDWQDPDVGTEYGTIIRVEMDPVDADTAAASGVFLLGGSGGVVGLTVYYPDQSISDVKIYPYTFYTNGSGDNYMLSTVRNVTVINGYRGVGATTTSERAHESLQIENFKGTFLICGIELYYSADVGNVTNVVIDSKYWKQYDGTLDETALDAYLRSNTTGMILGDVEWTNCSNIFIDGCNIGICTVLGMRGTSGVQYTGTVYNLQIANCNTGLRADYMDTRWGMTIARSSIAGSVCGIDNNTSAYIKLCDVTVEGGIEESQSGTVIYDQADLSAYDMDTESSYVKPASNILVANFIHSQRSYLGYTEYVDISAKLQGYLDRMAKLGGGIVYVPGGLYICKDAVTIPAGVELRGTSAVATREQNNSSNGTVFFCYYNTDGEGPKDTAFITLSGENAGLNGIRIIYGKNGPVLYDGVNESLSTSYAVRGTASGVYVVNSMISAAAYGIDFTGCDDHYIDSVVTCCYYNAFRLGGTGGTIRNCFQNGTVLVRTKAPVNSNTWIKESAIYTGLFYPILFQYCDYIIIEDAQGEQVYHNFAYGVHTMLTNTNSEDTVVLNLGTDMVGWGSAQLVMNGGSLYGVNIMRSVCRSSAALSYCPSTAVSAAVLYELESGSLELHNCLLLKQISSEKPNDTAVSATLLSGEIELSGTDQVRVVKTLEVPVNMSQYQNGSLALSLYISDMDLWNGRVIVEISSGGQDTNEIQWNVDKSGLTSEGGGWYTVSLRFADSTINSGLDFTNVSFVRIFQESGASSASITTIVKDVHAVSGN